MRAQQGTIPFFEQITGFAPYPWQRRCFHQVLAGQTPAALTLPTGTGKTSFVLLYLLALAQGAALPRRLVYVVDRRAIVDQTGAQVLDWIGSLSKIEEIAEPLKAMAAFTGIDAPVIETGILRGGLADTGEWRLDPAKPAVVIGTVDIVGSKLLFRGYGDGRSRRPLHAGLLGFDATVVLDESHLSAAFCATLSALSRLSQTRFGTSFRAVAMSATPNQGSGECLQEEDAQYPSLGQRIQACKTSLVHETSSPAERRQKMLDLALGYRSGSVLIFLRSAQEAQRFSRDLARALGDDGEGRVGLLTGTLRGAERQMLTESALWSCFSGASPADSGSIFLVATAAGEVGIDLDADHSIMDLAAMDSVIQRIGRVNRSGRQPQSDVHIVYSSKDVENDPKKDDWRHRYARSAQCSLQILSQMESLSPMAVQALDPERWAEAATPGARAAPPDLGRVELLAATSAGLEIPPVGVHLRGISDEPDYAETQVLWRHDVPLLLSVGLDAARDALAMHRPRPQEILKVPSRFAAAELDAIAKRLGEFQCLVVSPSGELAEITVSPDDRQLQRSLAFATVILPVAVGGLSPMGFLDGKSADKPVEDLADDDENVRFIESAAGLPDRPVPEWVAHAVVWRISLLDGDEDEVSRWLVYARRRLGDLSLDADSDLSRLARSVQGLDEHNERVGQAARRLGKALGLDTQIIEALGTAAGLHDEGKARKVWQRAAGNTTERSIAKSRRGRFRPALLGGFRHEFGSLATADRQLPIDPSDNSVRDLTLHLIAAHHGHARPGFPNQRQWDRELPDDQCRQLAIDTEERFIRLQEHYGPWVLAWLESLLKAADAWVSSGRDEGEHGHGR
ncbi:type I-U CRISPR-associated helicase/endonuclease Cas3 [Wenzhouxiangella limi]|uniref:Type I-U CRISPR-associated helicase/endonuclease Cas3 n=1 Tax=Wenzhouxiangella limi TaxID=2707351 RepID=A0A845UYR8_9GAMM|nr:type I-U CRISPR-associated helicase/endonuclease Cas3 [Wenzhouxiangella limi]NDY96973.1 type I-U CRISPR-associated helicase/endonuclease Cas3 [Wenzhouxiangella limi]